MHDLKPARLDEAQEAKAYRNKFPWKWVLVGALALGLGIGGYKLKQSREADALRNRILSVHGTQLHARSERMRTLQATIQGFVMDAVERTPTETADARLDVNQLRRGQGLYLRLSASSITNPARVAEGARSMTADAIMNCMGLAPVSARTLYEKGAFLDPAWTHETRDASDVLRLRVIEEELLHHIRTDLPAVEHAMASDWFMLVLERGTTRTNGPVDVFVWNLRDRANLLSVRTRAVGAIITAHANFAGAPAATGQATVTDRSEVAADCSIASQVRAATGTPAVSAENAPAPPADAPVAAPAPAPPAP